MKIKDYKLAAAVLAAMACGNYSCSKARVVTGSSALTIVNTLVGSNSLITNFGNISNGKATVSFGLYGSAAQISYGSYQEFSSYVASQPLSLSQSSDTLATIWSGSVSLSAGTIHTLFVTGPDTSHIDTMFTNDIVPYYPPSGDSLMGIRFANVSPGSSPISVDIQGSTGPPMVNNISYRNISSFQSLPADNNAQMNGYTIEFRDAASGDVLAVWPLTIILGKSQTLVFYGTLSSGQMVMQVNNF